MILKGYILIFVYIFSLIYLIGPVVKKKFNIEISRKIIHIMLFMVWIFIDIFLKNTVHVFIVSILFLIINVLSYKFKFFKSVEREDNNHLGTVYFAIAITIVMIVSYFIPEFYYPSGIAVFCLTFGDGFAALVGKNTKSLKVAKEKSFNGFISCLIASSVSLIVFNNIYKLNLEINYLIIIGIYVAVFELFDRGLDNLSVVFISFILSYLFMYLPSNLLTNSLIISLLIFIIVYASKSITYYGSIISMIIVFAYMYFGGTFGIVLLLSLYFFIFFISLLKKVLKVEKKDDKTRSAVQIIINGGLGTLFIVLYGIFKDINFLIISVIAVGGCFIDSVSSDVGTFSRGEPFDIFKMKKVSKGLSGGMSLLGTLSSLVCAILIAFIAYVFLHLSVKYTIIIGMLLFGQTIIDSFLGSLIQVKYKCLKCNKVSEKKTCCGKKTFKVSGFKSINNNVINALSSIIITLLALLFI